jgi:hypothetical protein
MSFLKYQSSVVPQEPEKGGKIVPFHRIGPFANIHGMKYAILMASILDQL